MTRLQSNEKNWLKKNADVTVQFFNHDDPIDYFRSNAKTHQEFLSDKVALETYSSSFFRVRNSIKNVIFANDDFLKNRTNDAIAKLKAATKELSKEPSNWVYFDLMVSNGGNLSFSSVQTRGPEKAIETFGASIPAYIIASIIQNFKSSLSSNQKDFPIGVCRLKSCQIFFVKNRKDQMYCTIQHGNTAAVQRKRRSQK